MHSTLRVTSRIYWIPLQHLLMLEMPTAHAARRCLSVSWGRNAGVRVEGCKNGKCRSAEAEPGEKGPKVGPTPAVLHMRSLGCTVTTSGFGICTAETLSQPTRCRISIFMMSFLRQMLYSLSREFLSVFRYLLRLSKVSNLVFISLKKIYFFCSHVINLHNLLNYMRIITSKPSVSRFEKKLI